MGVEHFLLGRNFWRVYQVLDHLASTKIVIRASLKHVWNHSQSQVGVPASAVLAALDQDLVLQPFEHVVVRAKVVNDDLEPLIFQNVVLNASIADASLQKVVFLEDCVSAVGQAGHLFISVINLSSNPQYVRGYSQRHLGTVVPVALVYRAILQQLSGAACEKKLRSIMDIDRIDHSVCKVYEA